jgi:hypothetical protein
LARPMPVRLRLTTSGTRWVLYVASVLVFLVGVQLFVLTEKTDVFFAWTINSPLSAAFLGAAYWASFTMEFSAARRRFWAHSRIAVPAVLVFTAITLVVSLVHVEVFHFDGSTVTRFITWTWLFVYAVVPPVMLGILFRQVRVAGVDPEPESALPRWFRGLLVGHAALLGFLGIALLVAPAAVSRVWPWPLTVLAGRAVGAWLVGLAIAAVHVVFENDWKRVQAATGAYFVFGLLELVAVARYPDEISWTTPQAWIYLSFLASATGAGLYGWLRGAQLTFHDTAPGQPQREP